MSEPKQVKIGELTFETFREKSNWMDGQGNLRDNSKWRWHCKAANGEKVCTSGESFDSKGNAERAMTNFAVLACHQEYLQVIEALRAEIYKQADDENYFADSAVLIRASVLLAHGASFQKGGGE